MAATKLDMKELERRKELSRKVRRPFERDWMLNLAFHAGEHYVEFHRDTGRLVALEMPADAQRPVHNYTAKITRTERAKILKTMPVPEALPATTSESDRHMSRVLNAQYRQWQDDWRWPRRLRNATFWIVTTGNVFLKWYWSDSARVAVVPPFDIYPDPYVKDMIDARWMIQANFLDEETAREIYGLRGGKLDRLVTTRSDSMSSLESRIFSNYSDGEVNIPGVMTWEYHEPPNRTRPKGRYIVWTKTGIVYESDYPYEHGKLPFTHIGHIARSNSAWYASVIDNIRELNREINRAEGQILENRNLANGKWFLPSTLELEHDPDARPRQVLKASGGAPDLRPEFYAINPLPSWVGQEPARLASIAQDLAGQHEVSHGGVPGRVESGQAIQLLQETDDSVMKDTIHSLEEAISEGFFMQSQNLRQYGDHQQTLQVYDREGRIEVFEFMKTDIPLKFRVQVQTTTGLPQSVAGRWDRVLNLWQYKVLTDPNQVLDMLDLSTESPELRANGEDRLKQWRETMEMVKTGQPIVPLPTDNHFVERTELTRFMRTEEFRDLPELNQQMLQFHLEKHEEFELMELTKDAERQAAAQGALLPQPGGAPGGGAGGAPAAGPTSPQDEIADPMPPAPAPGGGPAPVA